MNPFIYTDILQSTISFRHGDCGSTAAMTASTALLDPEVAPAPAKPELAQLRWCIQDRFQVGPLVVQEKPDERSAMSAVVETRQLLLGACCC